MVHLGPQTLQEESVAQQLEYYCKVKPIGHIWDLEFNQYVCFSFHGNWTTFGWDITNSILTLKIQGQGHGQGQTWWSHLRPCSFNMYAIHFMSIGAFLAQLYQIPYFTMKIQGQGHGQGQNYWSYLRPGVQPLCLLFVSWQLDHSSWDIAHWKFKVKVMVKVKADGRIRSSKFHIWPWKYKVKVMTEIDQNLIK